MAGRTEVGEPFLLSLEHAPDLALPLIRKGLLADAPIDITSVAAILAVIGKPWSFLELLGALRASDDQQKTADARAALLETGDEETQKAVLAWEERNAHKHDAGSYLVIDGRKHGASKTAVEVLGNISFEVTRLQSPTAPLATRNRTKNRLWRPLSVNGGIRKPVVHRGSVLSPDKSTWSPSNYVMRWMPAVVFCLRTPGCS